MSEGGRSYTAWGSDFSKVEVIDEKQFVEYTISGYRTTFTVTAREECRRWEVKNVLK